MRVSKDRLLLITESINYKTIEAVLKTKGLGGLNQITAFKNIFDFNKLRQYLFSKQNKQDVWDTIKWNDNNLWNAYVVSGYLGDANDIPKFINNFKMFVKDEHQHSL